MPPAQLHENLKKLFEFYRYKPDAKTKQPLFGRKAWKRAELVLANVRTGRISDLHGVELFQPLGFDKDDLMLFQCKRGTNSVENVHQKIIRLFGNSTMCPQLADAVLAEYREAHNYRLRIQHHDQPSVGHCDLALLDLLHAVTDRLWGIPLSASYRPTGSLVLATDPPAYGVGPTHEVGEVVLSDAVTNTDNDVRPAQVRWVAGRIKWGCTSRPFRLFLSSRLVCTID